MLVRFIVKNFLSFNKETEFNMLPGDVRRLPHHVYKNSKVDLLRSSAIYGSNGAGKSNLINGVRMLLTLVEEGNINSYSNSYKFRLDGENSKPSKFEIEFLFDNKIYIYGLELENDFIHEEWLYTSGMNLKEDTLLFHRKTNANGKTKIEVGTKFKTSSKDKYFFQILEEGLLRKDTILLFQLRDQKFKDFVRVFYWITNNIIIILPDFRMTKLPHFLYSDSKFMKFTNSLLQTFHTGVNEITIETFDLDRFLGEDYKNDKEDLLKQLSDNPIVDIDASTMVTMEKQKAVVKKIFAIHKNKEQENVQFEIEEESDGTIRLLDLIPAFYLLLNDKVTVIIDEINQSIHVSLLKELIKKFQDDSNTKGQLIFTTHESNLLDLEMFRQDEIWFAEKNKQNETVFYSLNEYNIRPEIDIRKGYLSGRFGAIPFLSNLKDLNWDKYGKEFK